MPESRLIGFCKCCDENQEPSWVPASEIGQTCHQCEDGFDHLDYIPRYRKRRAWIAKGDPDSDYSEVAFFDYDQAVAFENARRDD